MAQTVVGVTVNNFGSVPGFNIVEDPAITGVKISDLLDVSGVSTGYTLTLNGAFDLKEGSSAFATSSPDARFPLEFFRAAWRVGLSNDDAATHTIGSLPVGEPYKIEVSGTNSNSRATDFSVTGSTPTSATYTPGAVDPVPQPVVLEGTVPAGGEIVLSNIAANPLYAYLSGFLLTVGSDTPAVQTIRKSSNFNIETTLGTITTATLDGVDVWDHLSQAGTTVSFAGAATDEITTSGEVDLVLGDGSDTETIAVQVNVVGLPAKTAKKDGGLLVSLTDLTLDAFNESGTLVESLTGLTTNASGVISPVDLSTISEAVGDTLKVSLHSATSEVGVTFEQALENI